MSEILFARLDEIQAPVNLVLAAYAQLGPSPKTDFNAVGDGIADDTVPIENWLKYLAANGKMGWLPAGNYKLTRALAPIVGSSWGFRGAGRWVTSFIYTGANTTNDIITIGDGTNLYIGIEISGFSIKSTTTMASPSTALRSKLVSYSKFDDINVDPDVFTGRKVYNGIWFDSNNWISYTHGNISGQNDAIRVNNGSELDLDHLQILGIGANGIHVGGGFGGLYTGYVGIFGFGVGLRISLALTPGVGNNQIFVSNRTTIDNSTIHGVYIADNISSNKSFTMMGWSSSTKNSGSGFVNAGWANGFITFTGAEFLSNQGSGIIINDPTTRVIIDRSTLIGDNLLYGIQADVPTTNIRSDAVPINSGVAAFNANTGLVAISGTGGEIRAIAPTITSPVFTISFTATGLVKNADLVNSSTTINGTAIALGASGTITAAPSGSAGGSLAGTYPNPTVATNANLTGDVTSIGNATTLTNAPVIAKVLTGYASGAGTVSASDSILSAIQKLNGNNATNANLTGPITSIGNATSIANQTGTGTKFVMDTSPALAGTPTAPTAAVDTNTTQLATTAMVLAQASATTPVANATSGVVGTSTRFAREDHVHPQPLGTLVESEILAGSAVPLSSGVAANITSISLVAGDYLVFGSVNLAEGATTTTSYLIAWTSTTSATLPTGPNKGAYTVLPGIASGAFTFAIPVGAQRLHLTSTTTVYLSTQVGFAVSTLSAFGYIGALRIF